MIEIYTPPKAPLTHQSRPILGWSARAVAAAFACVIALVVVNTLVTIARAVAARPRLLLADELTGNLDEATGDDVFDLLLSLARDAGAGLLIVTHSSRLAKRADRQLHLSHGRVSE